MNDNVPPSLTMGHLQDLQAQGDAALAAQKPPPVTDAPPPAHAPADPKEQKLYTFDIHFKGPRGQIHQGRFTNKILSVGEKISAGVMRARLQLGVPLEVLSTETYNLLYMVTWLQQSLTQKPAWAQDLLALESEGLVRAIFDQVDAHELTFRGERSHPADGEEKA